MKNIFLILFCSLFFQDCKNNLEKEDLSKRKSYLKKDKLHFDNTFISNTNKGDGTNLNYFYNHNLTRVNHRIFFDIDYFKNIQNEYMLDHFVGFWDDANPYTYPGNNVYYLDTNNKKEFVIVYCRCLFDANVTAFKEFDFKRMFEYELAYKYKNVKHRNLFSTYTKEDSLIINHHAEFILAKTFNNKIELEYNNYTDVIDIKNNVEYKLMYVKGGLSKKEIVPTLEAYRNYNEVEVLPDKKK